MAVTKANLITQLVEKTGLTKKDASSFLDAFIESVQESLAAGEKVQLVAFGTCLTRHREAREVRSLITGEKIQIPASIAPVFKAGKGLKERLNS